MPQSAPPKRLEISQEDLEKVRKARERSESAKVDDTWLFTAEFGYHFGWEGIKAIRENEINYKEAELLLLGARKVRSGIMYDYAEASFIGAISANSKKPAKLFKSLTEKLIKKSKADI